MIRKKVVKSNDSELRYDNVFCSSVWYIPNIFNSNVPSDRIISNYVYFDNSTYVLILLQ